MFHRNSLRAPTPTASLTKRKRNSAPSIATQPIPLTEARQRKRPAENKKRHPHASVQIDAPRARALFRRVPEHQRRSRKARGADFPDSPARTRGPCQRAALAAKNAAHAAGAKGLPRAGRPPLMHVSRGAQRTRARRRRRASPESISARVPASPARAREI